MVFKPLERLENGGRIEDFDYFSRGACGKIYCSQEKAIKIPYDFHNGNFLRDRKTQWRLHEEFNVQKLAVDLGISFPAVYGVKSVFDEKGICYPAIFMKFLEGKDFGKLEGDILKEAENQRNLEIEKAKDFGFVIRDSHLMNSIWIPGEEKTYLLDAGLWKFRG
ncbi:MAG TPA: hypothetical protein VJ895_00345 [Candidatus Nanoarchaeia archaeon]|nr:hypothetical protein [Candidatus Nanoarchaeia archaeon]